VVSTRFACDQNNGKGRDICEKYYSLSIVPVIETAALSQGQLNQDVEEMDLVNFSKEVVKLSEKHIVQFIRPLYLQRTHHEPGGRMDDPPFDLRDRRKVVLVLPRLDIIKEH
jgi:hypothetical protein